MIEILTSAKENSTVASKLAKGLAVAKNDDDVAKAIVDAKNESNLRESNGATFVV